MEETELYLPYGQTIKFGFARWENIHSLAEGLRGKNGIYVWSLGLTTHNLRTYLQLRDTEEIQLFSRGKFKRRLFGTLRSRAANFNLETDEFEESLLITHLTTPPLYIGMSTDLGERIMQHLEGITSALRDKRGKDTDNIFALRFAEFKNRFDISESDLSIRVFPLPIKSKESLRKLELLLNNINNPILGVR